MPISNSDIPSGQVIGVDVGGTFTDLVMFDQATKKVSLAKVPSTLENQAFGVLNALDEAEAELANIDLIVHGTTTTTNAVLERKLCKTGLITTAGFRDILELGRRTRPQPYGMIGEFDPIIARDLRLEISERIDAAGEIVTPLDEEGVKNAVQQLLDAGCEALVIHFLHSYANNDHELRAAQIAGKIWPNSYISTGSSLLSESREFERGVTASINASVQPLLERYISRLVDELSAKGYGGDVLVMNGNGGMVSSRLVAREAAKTVMSGPASGVMAAAYTGGRAGMGDLITYDMGGTSTDVALIRGARPSVSNEIELEYAMPIHVPMVDVRTVGAGGGSIAKVNSAGLLEVGPQSAGASPGPICYGLGGQEPTISDANLLLGRLHFGSLKSAGSKDILENVTSIFSKKLARPLGLDATAAAAAVLQMANTKMAGAIRMVSISLGVDPRDFALFAFGGAGPLHASALARELGVPKVLVPARPGITNALGCIVADLRHDFVNTVNQPLDDVDIKAVHELFASRMEEGEKAISKENIGIKKLRYHYSVDMQFIGQTHLLRVDLSHAKPSALELHKLFEEAYFNRFHVELNEIRANLVNINVSVIGERDQLDLSTLIDPAGRKQDIGDARTDARPVYFNGDWHDTPIYWRDHLPENFVLHGPAIIEQMDTTIVIEPEDDATGDSDGNIIITIGKDVDSAVGSEGGIADSDAVKAEGDIVPVSGVQTANKANDLDPITLSVIQAGLQQVCDEMDLSFSRAAFSPVIAEANDRSDGIYSAVDGSLIAQGAGGLPVFVGTMQYSTRTLIERIKNGETAAPKPDDIYIVNDPYLGGTHLMDVRFAKPYYRNGKIFCWLSNTGHWPDTGGSVPGGFSASATSVEQEGLRLPPVRLFKQGQLDEEIYAIICSNIRVADQRIGDVKAQAAALMEGEKRLDEILDRYGDDTVNTAISELRTRAAAQMRNCISQIEDGSYKSVAYVDSDGVINEPLEIRLEITKSGNQLTFDFNGSSPPCIGPMNSVLATTLSSVYLAMRHIFPQVPISAGAFEPLVVIRPEGTFLDAQYPRPVSGCAAEVSQRIAEAVFAALVVPLPDLVTAAPAGTSGNFALGGYDPDKKRDFVMYQLSGGGYGGNADHDGLSNGCSTIGISKAPPVEIMEQAYPVLYHRYALREGSAGAGKHRGGFGLEYELELRRGKATASFVMDHGRFGPQGALGGSDGEPNEVTVFQAGKAYTPEHLSKEQDIPLAPGDRVRVKTPGGGGYGDPYLRDPEAVLVDVSLGRYNLDQAHKLFGVVINSDTRSVDEQKTKQLRASVC